MCQRLSDEDICNHPEMLLQNVQIFKDSSSVQYTANALENKLFPLCISDIICQSPLNQLNKAALLAI